MCCRDGIFRYSLAHADLGSQEGSAETSGLAYNPHLYLFIGFASTHSLIVYHAVSLLREMQAALLTLQARFNLRLQAIFRLAGLQEAVVSRGVHQARR